VDDAVRSLAQGASFGYADEIEAALETGLRKAGIPVILSARSEDGSSAIWQRSQAA
jgi:CO dehydrogenase/acetyl-CoA synthase alpha subunit